MGRLSLWCWARALPLACLHACLQLVPQPPPLHRKLVVPHRGSARGGPVTAVQTATIPTSAFLQAMRLGLPRAPAARANIDARARVLVMRVLELARAHVRTQPCRPRTGSCNDEKQKYEGCKIVSKLCSAALAIVSEGGLLLCCCILRAEP